MARYHIIKLPALPAALEASLHTILLGDIPKSRAFIGNPLTEARPGGPCSWPSFLIRRLGYLVYWPDAYNIVLEFVCSGEARMQQCLHVMFATFQGFAESVRLLILIISFPYRRYFRTLIEPLSKILCFKFSQNQR